MKNLTQAVLEAQKWSTKKEKHDALSGLDPLSLRLVEETFNPYRIFGIKKWNVPVSFSTLDASFQLFLDLLDKLHNRELTGNAAKNAVQSVLLHYTSDTAEILSRVLKKDLKCGASSTTFKDIYPDLNIPSYDIMLCAKVDKKYVWPDKVLCEQKLDGLRLTSFTSNGITNYLSRSGKPADWCNGVFDKELSLMEQQFGKPIVVDGEVLGDNYQTTMNAKGEDNHEAKSKLTFRAFDYMSLEEWNNQDCKIVQLERTTNLHSLIKNCKLTKIIPAESKIVNGLEEANAYYAEILEAGINDDGTSNGLGEGLIVKKLDGLYEWDSKKRSSTWAKWKPTIDVDLKVIGFYIGTEGTKNSDKLGGFYVEGQDENGNQIKSKCGGIKITGKMEDLIEKITKFYGVQVKDSKASNYESNKDQLIRKYIWDHQAEFIGVTITIECQELTMASGSSEYSLRFPYFTQVRYDKS